MSAGIPLARARRTIALAASLLSMLLAGCVPGRSPGERLYRRHCVSCHGVDGGGGGLYLADEGANLLDETWTYGSDPSELEYALVDDEVPKHKTWGFTSEERRQIVGHIRALRAERR